MPSTIYKAISNSHMSDSHSDIFIVSCTVPAYVFLPYIFSLNYQACLLLDKQHFTQLGPVNFNTRAVICENVPIRLHDCI